MALNNVPLSGQTLAGTRIPINQNFATINTAFLVNHGEYGLGDQGKHKMVQFIQQASGPTTSATELALYTKAVSGAPQLFLRRQSSGTEINLTSSVNTSPGYTRLPSGILIKWGTATVNGVTTIVMPTGGGIPAFVSTPFIVNFTLQNIGTSLTAMAYWNVSATTNLVLGINSANILSGSASTSVVTWIAIGV